jgi:hypothetical protein
MLMFVVENKHFSNGGCFFISIAKKLDVWRRHPESTFNAKIESVKNNDRVKTNTYLKRHIEQIYSEFFLSMNHRDICMM